MLKGMGALKIEQKAKNFTVFAGGNPAELLQENFLFIKKQYLKMY